MEKHKLIIDLKSNVAALSEALVCAEEQLCIAQEKAVKREQTSWAKFVRNDRAVLQNTGFPSIATCVPWTPDQSLLAS